ncbi:hypothetical protein GOODEAATRI_001459, partial [Goodea atripinnis]
SDVAFFFKGVIKSVTRKKLLLFIFQIMAIPPTYVDLGKSARDVFTKGYGKLQSYL